MSENLHHNASERISESASKAGKAAGKIAGKAAKKAVGKAIAGKAIAGAKLKLLGIIFLCFLITLPLLLVTDSTNLSFGVLTHTDEGDVLESEDLTSDYSDMDIIAEDMKYATYIIDAMLEDYDGLEEIIKDHCRSEGVDYDASAANIADNTIIPYITDPSGMADSTIRVLVLGDPAAAEKLREAGADEVTTSGEITDRYDALVITEKTDLHVASVKKFSEKKKPVLGISEGCQALNEAFGGTTDTEEHKGSHTVKLKPDSWLYSVSGASLTASHDHRKIKSVAPGFRATMFTEESGRNIVEGIENNTLPIWGISWTPGDDEIYQAFVEEIRKRKAVIPRSGYTANTPAIQGAIDWACMVANDDSFTYGQKPETNTIGCYLCGTTCGPVRYNKPEGYEKTYVCLTFIGAAYAHGAQDPEILAADRRGGMPMYENDSNFSAFSCWKKVGTCQSLDKSDLEPGDVLIDWADDNGSGHVCMYLGKDDLVESSGGGWDASSIQIVKDSAASRLSSLKSNSKNYVMRYVGNGPGAVDPDVFGIGKIAGASPISTGGGSVIEDVCSWAEKIATEGEYHYVHFDAGPAAEKCPICDNHSKNGAYYGWNCIGFVTAAFYHGGHVDSISCSNEGLANDSMLDDLLAYSTNQEALDRWKSRNGENWEIIRKNGAVLTENDLKRGDVIIEYAGSHSTHVLLYVGDGKVSDCTSIPNKIHYGRSWDGDDPVKVAFRYTGGGSGYKAYDEITTIETITSETGVVRELPSSSHYAYQSFAYNNGNLYLMRPVRGARGSGGYVQKVNTNLQQIRSSPDQSIYHANGVTYNTEDDLLYSATVAGIGDNMALRTIDPNTCRVTGEVSIPKQANAIAFDRVTKRFIISSGASEASDTASLHIYDPVFSKKVAARTIEKKRWHTPGDIAAYNGIIFVAVSDVPSGRSSGNYVDLYNEENGDYLGSIDCPYKELEGVDIDDDGQIILLFHGDPPTIQFTGISFRSLVGGTTSSYSLEDVVATRDVASVISAFSVYEAQRLPVLELDDDPSFLDMLIYRIRSAVMRDRDPEGTLQRKMANASNRRRVTGRPAFFNIVYADPVETGGKKVYPLIEVNPATSEQLSLLFGMSPNDPYETEFGSDDDPGSRGSGSSYTVGDTNVAEAIETNTDSHLELLYDSLRGNLSFDQSPLVLPIKNLFTSIPLTKNFSQDKKGIEADINGSETVYASERGLVEKVVSGRNGISVVILGKYEITYAGLTEATVKRGEMVSQNEIIGQSGSTFRMEVREEGTPIDPEPLFVKKNGLTNRNGGNGGGNGNSDIVAVAAAEVGATNGDKYRRWYTGRADGLAWCASFVSWCADQCGFIESGIIPKFAYVPAGVDWFKAKGQWQNRSYTPSPGDIIFFDWNLNGTADHVGIVESVDGNTINTIEGNTYGGKCARRQRSGVTIMGYGTPDYPESSSGGSVEGRRTTAPEEGNAYYSEPANKFPRNWARNGGNCTWYAWGRFMEYHGSTDIPLAFPSWNRAHAVMFYENTNYEKGQTPRAGSIAVWGYNGSKTGTPGHVAFVEEVKSNGDIECTESGWSGPLFAQRTYTKSSGYSMNYNNAVFVGFIYPKVERSSQGGKSEYQNYARSQLASHGWSDSEMEPLRKLWDRESGWNPRAENSSSGAYGIPQALPGNKMSSEGDDWRTNYKTQIRWGLKYIEQRYGSPSAAWRHFQNNNWY